MRTPEACKHTRAHVCCLGCDATPMYGLLLMEKTLHQISPDSILPPQSRSAWSSVMLVCCGRSFASPPPPRINVVLHVGVMIFFSWPDPAARNALRPSMWDNLNVKIWGCRGACFIQNKHAHLQGAICVVQSFFHQPLRGYCFLILCDRMH